MRRLATVLIWFILLAVVAPVLAGAVAGWARGWPANWHAADRSSTGTLPAAAEHDAMMPGSAWQSMIVDGG